MHKAEHSTHDTQASWVARTPPGPLQRLRNAVTGAIIRGERLPITEVIVTEALPLIDEVAE